MQKMPFRCEPRDSPPTSAAIHVVTHHWMTDRRKMNSNLMGSPRVQMRTQQVSRSKAGKADEVRSCLPAVIDDCHALSVSRVSRERFLNGQGVAVKMSPDHHRVTPLHSTGGDRRAQYPVRPLRFCDDEKTRCLLGEAVDNSRAIRSRTGGQITASSHQRVDECARPVSRSWMNDHSRGLVHYEQVLVLEHHRQRNRFRSDISHRNRRLIDNDSVTGDWTITRPLTHSVHGDVAVCAQSCRLSSRKLGP